MAFIVKKNIHGNDYYYLNENKREGIKVKTKTIAYLGKTKKDAEKKAKVILSESKSETKERIKKVNLMKKDISIEDMTTFCKRKSFVYSSSEIYGGFSGFWGVPFFDRLELVGNGLYCLGGLCCFVPQ